MRRVLATVLLTIVSTSALADWVYVTGNDFATLYMDFSTLRRQGNFVRVWTLSDWAKPEKLSDEVSYRSSRTLLEYDCIEEMTRIRASVAYADAMGKGTAVLSTTMISEWAHIPPESLAREMWEVACAFRP